MWWELRNSRRHRTAWNPGNLGGLCVKTECDRHEPECRRRNPFSLHCSMVGSLRHCCNPQNIPSVPDFRSLGTRGTREMQRLTHNREPND